MRFCGGPVFALVAQLDRASDFESAGRTFESCRAHKLRNLLSALFLKSDKAKKFPNSAAKGCILDKVTALKYSFKSIFFIRGEKWRLDSLKEKRSDGWV